MTTQRINEATGLVESFQAQLAKLKRGLNVGMPGIVVSYDHAKRRAVVQPALKMVREDGSELSRAPLVNVPVIQPSGGGFTVHLPLKKGDAVDLRFSQRGLARFKKTLAETAPEAGVIMSMASATAYPGWGPAEIAPAQSDAICIQSDDGATYIAVREDNVDVKADNVRITGDDPDTYIRMVGDSITMRAPNISLTSNNQTLNV